MPALLQVTAQGGCLSKEVVNIMKCLLKDSVKLPALNHFLGWRAVCSTANHWNRVMAPFEHASKPWTR